MSTNKNINELNAYLATTNKQMRTNIAQIKDGIQPKEERMNLVDKECNQLPSLYKKLQDTNKDGSFKADFMMEFEETVTETLDRFSSICKNIEAIKRDTQDIKEKTGNMEQNCIFLPFPATKTFKEAKLEILPKVTECLSTLSQLAISQFELEQKIAQIPSRESMMNDLQPFALGLLKYTVQAITADEL